MIVTTTGGLHGQDVEAYLGVVIGETTVAVNLVRDTVADIRDRIVARPDRHKRSGPYEEELRRAREIAMGEMELARASSAPMGSSGSTSTTRRWPAAPS